MQGFYDSTCFSAVTVDSVTGPHLFLPFSLDKGVAAGGQRCSSFFFLRRKMRWTHCFCNFIFPRFRIRAENKSEFHTDHIWSSAAQSRCSFVSIFAAPVLGGPRHVRSCPWTMKAGPCRSLLCSHETPPSLMAVCSRNPSLPPPPPVCCCIEISALSQSAESPFWFPGIKRIRLFTAYVRSSSP